MVRQEEFIRTIRLNNKEGVRMNRVQYDLLKEFILKVVDRENETTINDLIEKGKAEFGSDIQYNIGWAIYQVRLDLQARGLIRHSRAIAKKKMFTIKSNNLKMNQGDMVENDTPAEQTTVNVIVKQKFIPLDELILSVNILIIIMAL
jgi:hypothetical protein